MLTMSRVRGRPLADVAFHSDDSSAVNTAAVWAGSTDVALAESTPTTMHFGRIGKSVTHVPHCYPLARPLLLHRVRVPHSPQHQRNLLTSHHHPLPPPKPSHLRFLAPSLTLFPHSPPAPLLMASRATTRSRPQWQQSSTYLDLGPDLAVPDLDMDHDLNLRARCLGLP